MSLCEICRRNEIFFTRLSICKRCYELDEHSRNEISWKNRTDDFKKSEPKVNLELIEEFKPPTKKQNAIKHRLTKHQIALIEILGGDYRDIEDFETNPTEYIDILIDVEGMHHKATKSQIRVLYDLGYHGRMNLDMCAAKKEMQELLERKLGTTYDHSETFWHNFLAFKKTSSAVLAAERDNYNDLYSEDDENKKKSCPYCCNVGCETCNQCPQCEGEGCEMCDNTGKFEIYKSSLLHGSFPDDTDDDVSGMGVDQDNDKIDDVEGLEYYEGDTMDDD
jgi:hypothetical protein